MSNIRDLSRKINSLQNIQKVTRAMNMIASIKLKKLYEVQGPLELFNKKTDEMKNYILSSLNDLTHHVADGYEDVKKVHLVMFTADKGLCGKHNSSVLNSIYKFTKELSGSPNSRKLSGMRSLLTGFSRCLRLDSFAAETPARSSELVDGVNSLVMSLQLVFRAVAWQIIRLIVTTVFSCLAC